ncbi:hypothetical protein EI94DRAFT_1807763 [Lactarius quietus]|nr:hypothetical protein EI94DRAFT_1807763 [Lactarius quietus]
MPAARPIQKATRKTPYAKPGTVSALNNGKRLSPVLHHSTMGPDAKTNEVLSPVVKKKKGPVRRGKALTVPSVDIHSSDAKADEVLVPVNVKRVLGTGATQNKVRFGYGDRVPANIRLASNAPVKATRALPNRPGCNIHPAGVRKVRHTKEQVKADREAALKVAEEKDHEIRTSKELLAQMNVQEELEVEDLPVLYPQRLLTRLAKRRYAEPDSESEELECFDIRVDDVSDPDSSSKSDKEAETKPQRKRRIKGVARQELLSRTKELRLAERNEKSQAGTSKHSIGQFTKQDLVCKKYANFGLRQQPPTLPNTTYNEQVDMADPFNFGGLCDDDIEETRPTMLRDHKRGLLAIGVALRTPLATMRALALPDISQECLNNPHWTHTFLPTLSHTLYNSESLFTSWAWNFALLQTVQKVFDLSFSNISYTLSLEDGIVKAAYDQMRSRKSKLASDILKVVKTFFNSAEFRDRPDKVKEYVRWALAYGGPAYYETPVPKSCAFNGDPNCPKPKGFLRSQFILPIAKSYIGFVEKSVLHPSLRPNNPPKGLYALILTAVNVQSEPIQRVCLTHLVTSTINLMEGNEGFL